MKRYNIIHVEKKIITEVDPEGKHLTKYTRVLNFRRLSISFVL